MTEFIPDQPNTIRRLERESTDRKTNFNLAGGVYADDDAAFPFIHECGES